MRPDFSTLSISDRLKRLGYGHRPGTIYSTREVFSLKTGEVIGQWDAFSAVAFCREQEAA
jgi:hypothetical protein